MIIGTLTGGYSSCNNILGYDFYGRMHHHWDKNGDDIYSLRDWLDPKGTQAQALNSIQYKSIKENSSIKTKDEPQLNMAVSVYNKIMDVKCSFSNFTINVYNLLGEKIKSASTASSSASLDLNESSSGIYIVESINNEHRETQKVHIK